MEEIDLTENRLKEIDRRIIELKGLKKISFRKNLLENVEALQDMESAGAMVELVLYDNLIKRLPSLSKYTSIAKVDFSYNKVSPLPSVPSSPLHTSPHPPSLATDGGPFRIARAPSSDRCSRWRASRARRRKFIWRRTR